MYWLNENSRKFLAKGYLMDGQSAEDRIREIATIAERHLGKPGFADKFYDYMAKGYYSLATPIWPTTDTLVDFRLVASVRMLPTICLVFSRLMRK